MQIVKIIVQFFAVLSFLAVSSLFFLCNEVVENLNTPTVPTTDDPKWIPENNSINYAKNF